MNIPQVNEIAQMLDHTILHPTITDNEVKEGIETARRWGVASVCIKPFAISLAAAELKNTNVGVCTVIGFPQGVNHTEVKAYEAEKAISDGATELDMVVNTGKILSKDWAYVESDIRAVNQITKIHRAVLKVIFETDFLADDSDKIRLCEICSDIGVEFVKTSTGFGYIKGMDGKFSYTGATEHDLRLMRKHCSPKVQIKASGGVRKLDDVLRYLDLGVTRFGVTVTDSILNEASFRFGSQLKSSPLPRNSSDHY